MNLRVLGLNKFEGNAYEALLRMGKASASQVATTADVPHGRIYDVLDSLIAKGLVRVSPEKPRMYAAESPAAVKGLIEQKKANLEELEKDIGRLEKSFKARPMETVYMTRGRANFHRLVKELPDPKKFNYSIKYTAEFHPMWVREVKNQLKRGVELKTLTRYDEETKGNVRNWSKVQKNIRKIENNGVAMGITDDDHVLIGLIKSETHLVINDRAFVELMRDLFLAYWEKAERIK